MTMLGALRWPWGGELLLMSEVTLYLDMPRRLLQVENGNSAKRRRFMQNVNGSGSGFRGDGFGVLGWGFG